MSGKTRRIDDVSLAAFLTVARHRVEAIEGPGGRGAFYFADTPELAKDTLCFYNRETQVDALTFSESLRRLKSATYSA